MPDHLSRYHEQRSRLEALEAKHGPKLRRALIRSAASAIALYEEHGADAALMAAFVSTKEIIKALQALYFDCLPEASLTYDYLTEGQKSLAPPALLSRWGQRLKDFITKEGAESVRRITETTRKILKDTLNEAAAAGDGIKVAARKLRERVAALAPERAARIVRTELVSGSNYASLIGAQATGLQLDKVWQATPGLRTRPEHQQADGQRALLQDGFFLVGGELARYPGDPLLSAAMRINCRCSILYRQKEVVR